MIEADIREDAASSPPRQTCPGLSRRGAVLSVFFPHFKGNTVNDANRLTTSPGGLDPCRAAGERFRPEGRIAMHVTEGSADRQF
jgi:hypothetical protein